MSQASVNNSGKFLSASQFSNNEEIKDIAKLFPYSLPIQALLAKNLKQANKLDFDKFLKISSVISPDRTWLFNYINQTKQQELKIIDSNEIQEVKESNESSTLISLTNVEIVEFSPEIQILAHETPVTAFVDTVINDDQLVDDENLVRDALQSSKSQPTIEIISQGIENERVEPKEKKIIHHSLENTLEKEIMNVAIDKTIQREVDEITANEYVTAKITEPKITETTPEGFNYWLNPAKNQVQSREEKLKKIDALIEKFIKSEPRIVAKKVEFYSPVNVAKHSVEFNEDLVSEPLAAIFEKQGYFDKAIKAYEKLSLKFPEKRAYFAARIEKIGEIIKNIKNNK